MSAPSKSIDKTKRYAGVKTNDFVNKTRTNETSRAAARTQGWANLGKINSRRVPPPANVPSLKSETGTTPLAFDPTIPTGTSHGWTASGNQIPTNITSYQTRPLTPSKQPTQQQLDSLPAHSSTPPPQSSSSSLSLDIDKPRLPTTWSTITSGNPNGGNSNEQPPNLLGLNDFPRLATQDNKNIKSPSDSLISSLTATTTQGPSFRPANLASWKEGGGRAQPISNDSTPKDSNDNNLSSLTMQSQMLPTNSNLLQQQMQNPNNSSYMRMYQQQQQPQQMWAYNVGNSYGPYGTNQASAPMPLHQLHHSQRVSSFGNNSQSHQQRLNTSADYKTPTILRNKDIDDLSKLTDNLTWANTSQEVNYEEKIRFSDDEDNEPSDKNRSRRLNSQQQSRQAYPQVLQNNNRSLHTNYPQQQLATRSRLLHDDEHVKQMQDDKNSELINTLTVAKQRRDEQERNLRNKPYDDTVSQRKTTQKSFDDNKQMPGYQTRPLITSTGQENSKNSSQIDSASSSSWGQSNNTTTSRTRHDTADSQTFAMKSWSDQMDSFNYASLHEKSGGQVDTDDHNDDTTVVAASGTSVPNKYSRSHSESSSQSQVDNGTSITRSKHFPLSSRKQPKSNIISSNKTSSIQSRSKPKTTDVIDYFENNNNNNEQQQINSNDQWGDWDDSTKQSSDYLPTNNRYQQQYSTNRRRQQIPSDDNRYKEQMNDYNRNKQSSKPRSNASRSTDIPSSKSENKISNNKSQPAWRPLSPTRPVDTSDPTPQEAISYKTQSKPTEPHDRRQSAPNERKSRYTTSTTINTSSIPSLMSVRSDVPPLTTTKQFKTSNQSQRQDYNSSSHYSQRNDFYNETNDSTWGNDDEYYDDDTGYYDPNVQTHQRHPHSMGGYQSHLHHRGYTTLGSYGRYRRGGTLRHQQQYNTYNMNNTSGTSSQLNTSTGSKTKKTVTNRTPTTNNKKPDESSEQPKTVIEVPKVVTDETVKKPAAWTIEPKASIIEEVPVIKSIEIPIEIEKPNDSTTNVTSEQEKTVPKNENQSNVVLQSETEPIATNKKPITTNSQRKINKDQQNYYQNQQAPRHRNNYAQSMQDYEAMQMTDHNYYGTTRRITRGGRNARMHDVSNGYYYEHPQQRYNNRYNYSNEHYQQQPQTRSTNRTTKRGSSLTSTTTDRQQNKSQTSNNNNNLRQHSASDNELKEGEEWETASESSANMRTSHHDNTQQQQQQQVKSTATNETKSTNRDRTPPKKSFSSQRPLNSRYNEGGIHRRGYNLYDRGSKTTRGITHRTSRSTTNQKPTSPQNTDGEMSSIKQTSSMKKDQHRHSLDGYDLNNVAGVVKIETLPAGALEEESTVFDDGGEEFCIVMSKRGRKEQKAAQLSKQIAIESTNDQPIKSTLPSTSVDIDEPQGTEKPSNDVNPTNNTRTRTDKSLPPRFNSKSSTATTRQHNNKTDHQNASMYYYDPNYYYYDQNQYYDHDSSYYNYGNYNQSHRQQQQQTTTTTTAATRRKPQRNQQQQETTIVDDHLIERKIEPITTEKINSTSSNVMSNIQMWDPHTDNTISNSSKLIEKPTHDRKFGNEIVPLSSSNDASLPLHQRTATELTAHSPVSKSNETLARTIKPPVTDNKSDRENKTKSTSYEKNDTISSIGSNQLFEKSTFLDYDDKQSIGTVGDDYNQKINSLKTIWDISDHPSGQLEQTINSMVAMQQHQQDSNGQQTNSTKTDSYVKEAIPTSSGNIPGTNTNVSSTTNDDTNNKNTSSTNNLQPTGSSSAINQPPTYSSSSGPSKNEPKNICTVKPTQQVAPNIQDQVDVSGYQTFQAPPLPPAMSQASLQQPQHILPQSQVNPLHQQHSYQFYENLLPPPPPPQQQTQQQQQQQQFNRIYPSTTNTTSTDSINSDFSSVQSSQIYPPQNFSYRNTNVYMQPPPSVPNANSMYHHTSQGSISAPPQNNNMPPPPPMPSYPSPFLVDHGGHMISQQQPQPPPPQAYMNNQMMSGRPQGTPYYRTPPQQQIQTPPGPPPYGSQDPLAHGGYYPPFFQPHNSNAPPVGHPSPHNLYGQNEGFHPGHPPMFARGGSIDRGDHPLMSQPLSRPASYPSSSSNQQQQQQQPQGPPPSLLSQNLKSFHTNQQQTSSSNQPPFYPPPQANQYGRQPMPIGAMNTNNNRQQTQQVPSLMSGLSKNFSNNGNNAQSLFQHRQPLLPPQSNMNRPLYQHHTQYPTYSKSTGSNDDNVKPKHI